MGPDGTVHVLKEDPGVPLRKPLPCAVNSRSRNNVHRLAKEQPKHSDLTVCGIQMKGKRWSLTSATPTCTSCLEMG